MNYNDMKTLALDISLEDNRMRATQRDLYFDYVKKLFMHQPTTERRKSYAVTIINGQHKSVHVTKHCVLVGRYDLDVNPKWIMEDMACV